MPEVNQRTRKVAFPWFGGKTEHLKWLLPIINKAPHTTYVEPFGGSAAVLLNKNPSPVEVYNDIYGDVVNFFKVLRSRRDELLPLLDLTLYGREEFTAACESLSEDPLERARCFFVRARQSRTGLATTASAGRWSYGKNQSRNGMAMQVSRWLGGVAGLEDVCMRLKTVQIENLDGQDVMHRYDSEETLHYVDPPYLMSTRTGGVAYAHEFDKDKHICLLISLLSLKGKVVLSGYPNDLYANALKNWHEHRAEPKAARSTKEDDGSLSLRQEVIWTNFVDSGI